MIKAMFNGSPYVDFIPRPVKDSDPETMLSLEQIAKIPASLVNSQLDKNNIVQVAWDFFTSMAMAKAAILSLGWRYEKRIVKKRKTVVKNIADNLRTIVTGKFQFSWNEFEEEEETVWDDNEIQNVDWFDFWPDARGRNYNPDTWRHCWCRDWMTRSQIEAHREQIEKAGGSLFEITDDDWLRLKNSNSILLEGRDIRLSSIGKAAETRDSAADSSIKGDDKQVLYEVLKYFTGEEYGLIIAQEKLSNYGPTLYWRHKKIPFIFQPYDPLPNEIQGRSFCDWLYHLQEELDTNRRQRIDNRALAMNIQWITTDDDFYDENGGYVVSKPGKIHKASQQGALEPVKVLDMTGTSVQEEQIIHQDMENAMGTPAIAMGVDSQRDQTATEITTKNSNSSARFDIRINLYQVSFRRLWYLMDMNNQQFMTDNRLIQIADEEGIKKWRNVEPDDIAGEWDYIPSGVNIDPYANKELRRQQFMQMINLAAQLGMPWDKEKIGDDMLKTFDIRNPEKYKLSPEKIQEQQQAAMAQQQQQAQAETAKVQAESQVSMQTALIKILGDVIKESVKANPMMLNQLLGGMMQQNTGGQVIGQNSNIQSGGIGEVVPRMANNPGA
jgi:hypothetical protein